MRSRCVSPGVHTRTREGFSYVELLVSLVIMMVLYALWLGPSSQSIQERRKRECAVQLQQVAMAISAYAADHDGAFPVVAAATNPSQPLSLLAPQYLSDASLLICPGSRDSALRAGTAISGRRISYAYYMGYSIPPGSTLPGSETWPLLSDAQIDAAPKRRNKPVFAVADRAPGNNHRAFGGNVLFADGHCERAEPFLEHDLPVPPGVLLLNP